LDKLESIYIGSGVKCEVCYNMTTIHYEAEENEMFNTLITMKEKYQQQENEYNILLRRGISKFSL
jgi:hypothetical protein